MQVILRENKEKGFFFFFFFPPLSFFRKKKKKKKKKKICCVSVTSLALSKTLTSEHSSHHQIGAMQEGRGGNPICMLWRIKGTSVYFFLPFFLIVIFLVAPGTHMYICHVWLLKECNKRKLKKDSLAKT